MTAGENESLIETALRLAWEGDVDTAPIRQNAVTTEFGRSEGTGIGASHQTGWTGVIATRIQLFGALDAEAFIGFFHDEQQTA